jgi:hypothetical protein
MMAEPFPEHDLPGGIRMAQLDLRPLTIGEILDRMFTLYRRHFVLFTGIATLPQIVSLAFNLGRTFFLNNPGTPRIIPGLTIVVVFFVSMVTTLFAQAATILAVSDLYLSRPVTISDCLRRAWAEIGTVLAVGILNFLAVAAGFIALIIPGIYVMCRLSVSVPAALIEQRSAQEALSRSWNLTKDNAGRAFVLFLLYLAISMAGGMLIGVPFAVATMVYKNNPGTLREVVALSQVANALLNIVLVPILLIATSVFYFDLRVRKEAFDLQFMMDPTSERMTPPGTGSVPSILS